MSDEHASDDDKAQPAETADQVQFGSDERGRFPMRTLGLLIGLLLIVDVLAVIFVRTKPGRTVSTCVAAIEGSFRFTDCTGAATGRPERKCEPRAVCPVIGSMRRVHGLLEQCLTGVSIADFASGTVPETITLKRTTGRSRRKPTEPACRS